jgi:hypothetical protein
MYYLLFTSTELDEAADRFALDAMVKSKLKAVALWPPDVFCLAAALLKQSNAYTRSRSILPNELKDIEIKAGQWLDAIAKSDEPYPPIFKTLMKLSLNEGEGGDNEIRRRERPINSTVAGDDRIKDLLWLLIISDFASTGFGLHDSSVDERGPSAVSAKYYADTLVEPGMSGSTLCVNIAASKARVLPKTHTPARGLSLRSMSHNLAYVDSDQGSPLWFTIPGLHPNLSSLNVLLVPYPYSIKNLSFSVGDEIGPEHSYFLYLPEDSFGTCVELIERLCQKAQADSGRPVDIVVMPELAMNVKDYRLLQASMRQRGIMLISGVGGKTQEGREENRICIDIPLGDGYAVHLRQKKHHHWQLEGRQIHQYKLASVFDPYKQYWERLQIGDRQLCFIALHPRLLVNVLVCEDLAQYEPVGKLVRAVGPNLVIALLMDAPQIRGRWPDRYASVLTDDPGSSVLTLTCLGMSIRSKRENDPKDKSRTIGLWKDPLSEPVELELAENARAVLLTLTIDERDEWTTDLRRRTAYVPRLSGTQQIVLDPEKVAVHSAERRTPDTVDRHADHTEVRSVLAPGDATALSRLAWLQGVCESAARAVPSSTKEMNVARTVLPWLEEFYRLKWPEIRSRLGPHAREIADCMIPEGTDEPQQPEDPMMTWTTLAIQEKAMRFLGQHPPGEFDERHRKMKFVEHLKRWRLAGTRRV